METHTEISLTRFLALSIYRRLSLALILLAIIPLVAFGQNNNNKITICHKGETIEISINALQTHLNHGDAAGPCEPPQDYDGTVSSYYESPGKVEEIIGSELTALNESFDENGSAASDEIFVISESQLVLIEIVAQRGKKQDVITLLSGTYGITEFLDNGASELIVTVLFPIDNLPDLNLRDDIIRFVRPVYQGITNSGVVTSLGDAAQQSDNARSAFGVDGAGIKIGVMSDSYNLKGFADTDIRNGDLPGPGNPDGNILPVDVLKDYPSDDIGSRFSYTDEGRAMLQIIHDVAPRAEVAFRTGVISPGDMAAGILELEAAGCEIIVDDITFYKEPFFMDGGVARAVDLVTSLGVLYFTSAGNFGKNSYEAQFNPGGPDGKTHDFIPGNSGEDNFQGISMNSGFARIVLQWDDDYYSQDTPITDGARNDLDIYIISDEGDTLVNNNTNNIGLDPIEIMTFQVDDGFALSNIVIHKASGPDNVNFKYIVFEGREFKFKNYAAGSSTITGHANSAAAMTVGAVLYFNTPVFGNEATIASFSSWGGLEVDGNDRRKPDFIAPNGVNTTVDLKGFDIDGDLFPNFFGTSASAPHAAGAAALLLQARTKFGVSFELRQLLQQTAIDMETPGFDNTSGDGFIQADGALLTFAAPAPTITELIVPDGAEPGLAPFDLTIKGKNLHENSQVMMEGILLPPGTTTLISSTELEAAIPAFIGDPAIQVITSSITPTGEDGGISEPLYLFRAPKKVVKVTTDNKTKKYGERLPEFTVSVTVDGEPLASTELTLEDLGLDNLTFNTTATSLGSVGFYVISPVDNLDEALHDVFDYEFINGTLVVEKTLLKITPNDLTKVYGEKITGITFNYEYDMTNIDPVNNEILLDNLMQSHQSTFIGIDSIAVLDRGKGIVNRGKGIVNGTGWLITPNTLINRGKGIVNGNFVIDIADELLEDYVLDPANTLTNRGKGIVNGGAFALGEATMNRGKGIVNDDGSITVDRGKGIVNDGILVNSDGGFEGFDDLIVIVDTTDYAVSSLFSINLISGLEVTTEDSLHYIVPGGYLAAESENFEISYGLGNLTILPASLNVTVDDKQIIEGDPIPEFTSTISGFAYEENETEVFSSITYTPNSYDGAGTYPIVPTLVFADQVNYVFDPDPIVSGTLTVESINGNIAFAHVNLSSNLEIELVNSDGSNPVSLPVGSESIRDPQFAPNKAQIVFTLSPTADTAPVFNPANGHYYELVQSGIITWANANTAANAASPTTPMPTNFTGHLVTITDQGENDFVGNLSDEDFRPWIGLTDETVEGTFQWVTGEPFVYSNWSPGEPSGDGDHVEFFASNEKWNDIAASNKVTASYVIEYESTTSPVPPSVPNLQTPQDQSLWKVNVDGSGLTELTSGTSNHSSSFSPDGTKIAFIKDNKVAIMNADGTGTTIFLTSSSTSKRWTAFSPDGQEVVYVQSAEDIYTDSFNSISKVNINTHSTEQISPANSRFYYRSPVFLKDGSRIIYVRHDKDGGTPSTIMSMNPDGSGETTLLINDYITNDVDVSPDNTKLLFSLQDSGGTDYTLNTMDIDGTNVEELYREANLILWPSWGINQNALDILYVNIPDPNFEQALIDLGIDSDGIINQQMLRSDAEAVTSLNVSDPLNNPNLPNVLGKIADLTGIEAFVNLSILESQYNELTSLDVSQNTALTELLVWDNQLTDLYLSRNTALTNLNCDLNQLTSLDLSNNTALIYLTCSDNNLVSLDLPQSTALLELYTINNQLTSLDVSHNPGLTLLNCDFNQLEVLDVSHNFSLVYLFSQYNQLTALDVSHNTALTTLYLESNQLTSLDVSQNTLLVDLSFHTNLVATLDVSHNKSLVSLQCGSNLLTELNLSQNTALTGLFCDFNQLANLNVSQNTALTALSCFDNLLTSLDVSLNTALQLLNSGLNPLTELDVSQSTNLSVLICSHDQLTSLDVSQNILLTELLVDNNQLSSLDIRNGNNHNFITLDATNNNLSCISVDDQNADHSNWLVDGGVIFSNDCDLAVSIPDANFEQALIDLGIDSDLVINGQITRSDALATTSMNFGIVDLGITDVTGIQAFVNLTSLYITNNDLTNTLDLSQNTALRYLRCDYNNLTELDVSNNTALVYMRTGGNFNLGTLHVNANTELTTLRAGQNGLSSIDVSSNQKLELLDISFNSLSTLDLSNNTALKTLVNINNSLQTLDLSNNLSLEWLNFSGNDITQLDVSHLVNLREIRCRDNDLLESLNISNGHNHEFSVVKVLDNVLLNCMTVDDETVDYRTAPYNWEVDNEVSFSNDCTDGLLSSGNITVFPNPVIDYLELVHADESVPVRDISVRIYDNNGNEQFSFNYGPATVELDEVPYDGLEIDMTQLQAGFYILHVNDQRVVEIIRVQKE